MEDGTTPEAKTNPPDESKRIEGERSKALRSAGMSERVAVRLLTLAAVINLILANPYVAGKLSLVFPALAAFLGGPQGIILGLYMVSIVPALLAVYYMTNKLGFEGQAKELGDKIKNLKPAKA